MPGVPSGEESIKSFTRYLEKEPIESACSYLKGIFFILITLKATGQTFAFVDNSGLYHSFYTETTVSSSFLKLAKYNSYSSADFDPVAVAEFLHFGFFYSFKTFIPQIKKILYNEIVCVTQFKATIEIRNKKIPVFFNHTGRLSFKQFFNELAISLKNCNFSVDLTGGIDSRLITAMLRQSGSKFETAMTGGEETYPDIAISKKVAKAVGCPWFGTIHSARFFFSDLRNLVKATDGLYDVIYYHRLYQFQIERKKRGIDTIISGVGGELFKDYWWLHEFPFYYKKNPGIEKFVDKRILANNSLTGILYGAVQDASILLRDNLIKLFSTYTLDINTRTIDNIYFHIIMGSVAGRELTSHSFFLKCYAPFLDPELASAGFNLSRRSRLYNLIHRKELTKLYPAIAKLATNENGISVSYNFKDMITDLPFYCQEKMKRALVKLRITSKKKSENLNDPALYPIIRKSKIMSDSFNRLKKIGFIQRRASLNQINNKHLGSLLTLGLVSAELDTKSFKKKDSQ